MPIINLRKTEMGIHLAIWQVTESHDELMAMLSSEILTDSTLAEIHHPAKQIEFFASRLCIEVLAKSLGVNYLGLKKDMYGKPFLVGSSWQISLTHTSKFVAVIMHPKAAIGIDMEKPSEKLRRVAAKFLDTSEILAAQNDIEKLCIYWSAKEVMYKLYGEKKVVFNENLYVCPFKTQDEYILGKINMATYRADINIEIIKWQGFMLLIGIDSAAIP